MKKLFKSLMGLPISVRASFAFLMANIITKGITYLTTPIYTRLMTAEQYGQISIFLTWLQVFGILAMFSLSAGVFNNGMVDYPKERDEFSFSMLILSNVITIIFAFIIVKLYPMINEYVKLDISWIILMCVIFMFQPAYNFWIAKQRYELKYISVFIMSIVSAIVPTAIAVVSVIYAEDKVAGRLFGAELPLVLIYVIIYIYIAIKAKGKLNFKYWKFAITFNLPLIPHYLSTYLLSSADTLMIAYMIDDSAAAFYSVAYSVAIVVTIIWTAVNGTLVPFTYEKCKEKKYEEINTVTIPILALFAVCCSVLIIMAPELVYFMATEEYMEAIYVIPPIVAGVFFQVQYYIYANIIYYHKKPKYVMLGSLIAMVLNILLNYWLIGIFGYLAAGYTTLICYMIQAVIDYYAMKRIVGHSVYNMRIIFALSLGIIIFSLVSIIVYESLVIRYTILGICFLLLIRYRNLIIKKLFGWRK